MASTSETGHNKNVANFSTAYQILEERVRFTIHQMQKYN